MSEIAVNFEQLDVQEGDLCKFTYVQQSGNYRWYVWTCTAVFLANLGDRVVISFRPLAGTSYIYLENMSSVEVVTTVSQRRNNKFSDAANVRLPKRRPGAVPAPSL